MAIWYRARKITLSKFGTKTTTLKSHTNLITCLVRLFVVENEREEMVTYADGHLSIKTMIYSSLKQTLMGHKHYVLCLASKGLYLASGSLKEIRIWLLMIMNVDGRQVKVESNN